MKVLEYFRNQNSDLIEPNENFSDSGESDSESENEEENTNSEIRTPNDITLKFRPIFEQSKKKWSLIEKSIRHNKSVKNSSDS